MVETGSNAASTAALMANVKGGINTLFAGQLSVAVLHGLPGIPTGVSITPARTSLGVDIWEDDTLRTSTVFTVKIDFVQTEDLIFTWMAVR